MKRDFALPSATRSSAVFCCMVLLLVSACTTSRFNPPAYSPQGGSPTIENARSVVICQPFVRVTKEELATYDQRFHPSDYLKDMLESELAIRDVPCVEADFGTVKNEAELVRILAGKDAVPAGSVVMTASLVWFPDVSRTVCDVKVYSDKGELLFRKRGMCISHDLSWTGIIGQPKPFDASVVDNDPKLASQRETYLRPSRMAMKQIFDDPALRKLLRKDS